MKPWPLIFKLVPALIAAIGDLTKALRKDSPGGKKVTADEASKIAAKILETLHPIVVAEVTRQLGK